MAKKGRNKPDKKWVEKPIEPVPRAVRDLFSGKGHRDVKIDKAPRHRERWTDGECEVVIKATPTEYSSYYELGEKLGRGPGAVHWRKQIVIHLLHGEPYALEQAESKDPRLHDWRQMYRVLKERGYLDMPVEERIKLAQPLPQPSSSWRGDHTQRVLKEKKEQELIYREVRKLLDQRPEKQSDLSEDVDEL